MRHGITALVPNEPTADTPRDVSLTDVERHASLSRQGENTLEARKVEHKIEKDIHEESQIVQEDVARGVNTADLGTETPSEPSQSAGGQSTKAVQSAVRRVLMAGGLVGLALIAGAVALASRWFS